MSRPPQTTDQDTPPSDLVPGRKPVLELLRADPGRVDSVLLQQGARGPELSDIIDRCRELRIRFRTLPKAELDRLFQGNHQGVLARSAALSFIGLDELLEAVPGAPLPLIVALDQVQDPGNVGALVRTLYALGGAGLILPKDRTAFVGPAVAKASAGAVHRLPVCRVTNLARALDRCADALLTIYGAMAPHSPDPHSPDAENAFTARLDMPAVLVLGNEEKGIRPNVAKRCERALAIPMAREFDSLNVAQAGAILMAAFARASA